MGERRPGRASWRVVLVMALLPACAFDDGRPWGVLDVALEAAFEAPPSRLEDGKLKSARSYLVDVEDLILAVEEVTVTQSAGTTPGADVFDPARPPPGYTLCHNGHCHHQDGRLVDYEDIIAELTGGAAAGGASLSIPVAGDAVAVGLGEAAPVALGRCPGACEMERGALERVAVAVTSLHVRGVAFEGSALGEPRLPPEGRPFDLVLDITSAGPSALLGRRFDRGEQVGLGLDVTLLIPASLFDRVDWQVASDAEVASGVEGELAESLALRVVERPFDID